MAPQALARGGEQVFVPVGYGAAMGRRADPAKVREARLWGAVARLRDVWVGDAEQAARLRAEWPGLAEVVDRLVELVRWDRR